MMNDRDKSILNDLQTFRCMSRDQITRLHFNHLKNPINSCNSVLKRLSRDQRIKSSKQYTPYVYFPYESKIKPDSQKIPHFLSLVDTVIEMNQFREPNHLIIEPKYGKGAIEPDLFAIWYQPIFIEVQRNQYTKEVMQKKINLYEEFYHSGEWRNETWQKPDKKVFPSILILTPTRYPIQTDTLKVYQAPSISDFIATIQGNAPQPQNAPSKPVIKSNGSGTLSWNIPQ
jgi:hypothetical protein